MKFHVVNLGCRVNRVESDAIAAQLVQAGLETDKDNPDVVVVNTCTVTGEADKKTRKAVHRALRENPDAMVVVTGCAAAIDPETYRSMSNRVRIVGKAGVAEAVLALDEHAMHGQVDPERALRFGGGFPTRVGIKVQDGCDNACTYCIVHVARGASTSRPADECVDEAVALYDAGAREIVLTGIDLGSYRDGEVGLPALVRMLLEKMPGARVRISSIEPPSVDDELIDVMAGAGGYVCRHLHLPLQSGSSRVLEEMGRAYSAQEYAALVDRLYKAMPSLALTTDIIVGFPGETEQDFLETLDMVRRCRFTKVHAFRYSRRSGTPAASRTDQIPADVVAQRASRLHEVANDVRRKEQVARIGTEELLLVEQEGTATSESFFTVRVDTCERRGDLVRRSLTTLGDDGIFSV